MLLPYALCLELMLLVLGSSPGTVMAYNASMLRV